MRNLKLNFLSKIEIDPENLSFNIMEEKIIRKIFEWPKIIESASRKFDLHKIPFYLYDLSTLFHAYWSKVMRTKRISLWKMKRLKKRNIINKSSSNCNTKWNGNSRCIVAKKM